jgi:hypothetical protein
MTVVAPDNPLGACNRGDRALHEVHVQPECMSEELESCTAHNSASSGVTKDLYVLSVD